MKKIYCIIALILLVLASGCGKQEDIKESAINKDNDTVILAGYRQLAPGNKDAYCCSSSLGVWEPLITKDKDNKPAPCLAQSWEMQDNGKIWIFHLRKKVLFHNGTKFMADSVQPLPLSVSTYRLILLIRWVEKIHYQKWILKALRE